MFLFPLVSFADGGFLNVDVKVYNQRGGSLTDKDFSYQVVYGPFSDTLNGSTQAFNFPKYNDTGVFNYQVVPNVPQGYVVKLDTKEKLGCSDTLDSKRMTLVNCTVYFFDDTFVVEAPAPVVVATPTPALVSAPVTVQPTELIVPDTATLEAQIAQLLQMIELLKQLIVLQTQLNNLSL